MSSFRSYCTGLRKEKGNKQRSIQSAIDVQVSIERLHRKMAVSSSEGASPEKKYTDIHCNYDTVSLQSEMILRFANFTSF